MSSVNLKIKLQAQQEESRRISILSTITLEELRAKLQALFQRQNLLEEFSLQYEDMDGDLVTVCYLPLVS
jgi:hypothetical protein